MMTIQKTLQHIVKRYLIFSLIFFSNPFLGNAQKEIDSGILQLTPLDSVSVTAFRNQYLRIQQPASVVVLSKKELSIMGGVSLLPAFNQIPGVKMEERSPGSFRLSVRGSLLRSPFGVRNLKIYLNQIPLTDAGGNTYLNIIPTGMLEGVEIIKGPAASVYGAGTGGVILLKSGNDAITEIHKRQLSVSITGGSFGLFKQSDGIGKKRIPRFPFIKIISVLRAIANKRLLTGMHWQRGFYINRASNVLLSKSCTVIYFIKLRADSPLLSFNKIQPVLVRQRLRSRVPLLRIARLKTRLTKFHYIIPYSWHLPGK